MSANFCRPKRLIGRHLVSFTRAGAGVLADFDPPRIWTPDTYPLADLDSQGPYPLADSHPLLRIWTPLPPEIQRKKHFLVKNFILRVVVDYL